MALFPDIFAIFKIRTFERRTPVDVDANEPPDCASLPLRGNVGVPDPQRGMKPDISCLSTVV